MKTFALILLAGAMAAQETVTQEPLGAPEGLTAAEWAEVRAAHAESRYAAHALEDGYVARNPGQQWRTRFDGRGFITEPDGDAWTWGLQLQRYGFVGQQRTVVHPEHVGAEGGRVVYDWDEVLREWYVNDSRGLEHGFTVRQRPESPTDGGPAQPLTFSFAVLGALTPAITDDGRGVHFGKDDGTTALTYSGLTVFDADGQTLPARFESASEGLLLIVDESGAHYPLTIDPLAQQAYLKASNTSYADEFGISAAISGNTLVVGAHKEDSGATGVNGDQGDGLYTSGAAYVFVRNGTSWSQQAYLKASNTDAGDYFGVAVAIDGDTIVVGAWTERSNATGVDGDQTNNSLVGAGAAYVFARSGTVWTQQAYLKASNTDQGDWYGKALAVSGDTVVVGSLLEGSDAVGVNGDPFNNNAPGSGAVYVYGRSGSTWTQDAYLKSSNSESGDQFGRSVSISDDTIVVGATGENSNATGVNGDQTNNSMTYAGAAYVFVGGLGNWTQQAYLKASNPGNWDAFGNVLSISGDTLVLGAPGEDSYATGVDGDGSDNSGIDSGAAYVFARTGVSWTQQAYLKAEYTGIQDVFAYAVCAADNMVVVSANLEDSNAIGVNGDGNNNLGVDSGAAYVFARSGSTWSQSHYLKAFNAQAADRMGDAVGISGSTILVSAVFEGGSGTGANPPDDNDTPYSGAVYVFDDISNAWADQGSALAGVSGDPLLVGSGVLADGSSNSVDLSNAAPSATAGLFIALASTPVPFKGGTLLPFPFFDPLLLTTDGIGAMAIPFTMPSGIPAGTELWVQWAIQDAAAINGVSLSNAIQGLTP